MNNCIDSITTTSNMSWFVVSVIILGLWKYDRCLLDKLERWAWKKTTTTLWSIFEMYSNYKDKNEMIKDGYHVDTVYMWEHKSSTNSNKYDVLTIFRREIVKETFTNKKSIEFDEFLRMCTEEGSNFKYDPNLEYELEVNYTFDRKQYKIFYSNNENDKIKFPIYSESEMANADMNNSIISAQIIRENDDQGGIEIDELMLKFAGPKGNFYDDSDFVVKKSWLKFSGIDDHSKVLIMDLEGNNFVFDNEDEFLTLNKE